MENVTLNNGVKMPILGLGVFQVNNLDECEQSVLTALETGYRLVDTAQSYQNQTAVGNAIKKSGIDRKELFIVTKVNFKSYENTRETVLNSLKNLQVDYLDMVLLHWPFGNYYQAWKELEKLYASVRNIREGKPATTTLKEAFASVSAGHPNDWLLSVEIAELAKKEGNSDLVDKALNHLEKVKSNRPEVAHLIDNGLELIFEKANA